MPKIYLIHGWGGSPTEPMHTWLKENLTKAGFEVVVPEMPEAEEPQIKPWLAKMREVVGTPNKQTYFIGHSIGCQTILRYFETLPAGIKVGRVFFIAPWMFLDDEAIAEEGEVAVEIQEEWEATSVDWDIVRAIAYSGATR